MPLSAEHGEGMVDLYEALLATLGEEAAFAPEDEPAGEDDEDAYDETAPLRIAVAGRPNAGKSTLVNRLLGEDRLLTGPEAGLTRDSIAVEFA